MRVPYYCPYCNQRSTRRWNLDVHIKRKHGGYLLGRPSDPYVANNHPLYSKSLQLGHVTVADSVGETFQPRYLPQRSTVGTSQYSSRPIHRPMQTAHDHNYGDGLSQETLVKVDQLKRLLGKYSRYHANPDGILKLAIYNSNNGDTTFLDAKLEQLSLLDSYNNWQNGHNIE